MAAYAPLLFVSLYMTYDSACQLISKKKNRVIQEELLQPTSTLFQNVSGVTLLAVVTVTSFICTLLLPHLWFISYMPLVHENAYYVQDSTSSLIHNVKFYEGEITKFVSVLDTPVPTGKSTMIPTNHTGSTASSMEMLLLWYQ